jgi:hypothetical protein
MPVGHLTTKDVRGVPAEPHETTIGIWVADSQSVFRDVEIRRALEKLVDLSPTDGASNPVLAPDDLKPFLPAGVSPYGPQRW